MFPEELGTSARVEAEEVGVKGDGSVGIGCVDAAGGCCVCAGARGSVIELVEIIMGTCGAVAPEYERELVAVGNFVTI